MCSGVLLGESKRCIDPLLVAALGAAGGLALALAPVPTAAAAAAIAILLRRQRASVVVALALMTIGALRVRAVLDEARVGHRAAAVELAGLARCQLHGTVASSPVVAEVHASRAAPERASVTVDVTGGDCDGRPVAPLRLRLHDAPEHLGRGDHVAALVDLGAVELYQNPGAPNPWVRVALSGVVASGRPIEIALVERGHGIGHWIDRARAHVRGRIEATFDPAHAPLARALVLGESDLAREERDAFRLSGLAHLLAVSGTHLVIAVVALARALRALLVRIPPIAERIEAGRLSAACVLPIAWLYADFAGGGGSALRAAAMLGIGLLVHALGRRPSALRVFAASLLGGALVEPLALGDLSFTLSLAATAGLFVWRARSADRPPVKGLALAWRTIADALWVSVAATAACAPVLLGVGAELPLLGVFANVLAAPVGELAALPLCLAHALLAWAPAAEQGAAIVAQGALGLVRAVAQETSAHRWGVLALPPPTPAELAVLAVAAVAAWLARDRRSRAFRIAAATALLALLEWQASRAGAPHDVLRVTVLDVGQGDAVLVDLPDGSAMLVDGGGGPQDGTAVAERALLPVLRARRRSHIDRVVLTHAHPDHYGGLVALEGRVPFGELWHNGTIDPARDTPLSRWLARQIEAGVIVRAADLCGHHVLGGTTVRVLAPCGDHDSDFAENDRSLVLRLSYGDRAALLAGDAEAAAEEALLAHAPSGLRADFLKVGHHGSRTSSSPHFLAAVAPSVAAISCGIRNRFGHPHPEVLDALHNHTRVLRTDRDGAVVWQTDGAATWATRPAAE